jgi:hypothetical protein
VVASGLKFVDLLIKIFNGEKIEPKELQFKPGLIMTRYNEELFLNPEAVMHIA